MNRRNSTSIVANPILIGAVTVLVIIVAVFFAYNANNGLPFVPTYQLTVEVPDAANLVTGNEARIGGDRIGIISAIRPVVHDDGTSSAKLTLKLETDVKPLPKDTQFMVRPRSSLGLKYLEVRPGTSKQGFADGATVPLENVTPRPVEIDEVFNMFDEPTRVAMQVNQREFGNALAGRGTAINAAIAALDPLTRDVLPVLRGLNDPNTELGRLVPALEQTAAAVAPVAERQAVLFRGLAATFDALATVSRPYLQDAISGGPPALDTAIRLLPRQRAFIANSTGLFRDLQPGVEALSTSAPLLASALTTGARTVRRANTLSRELERTLRTTASFAEDPQVALGLNGLRGTAEELAPTAAHLAGAQVNCNYLALLVNNVASALSDGDVTGQGTWARIQAIAAPIGHNSEVGPASAPANGPEPNNFLHSNPYPYVGAPGQNGICMAGNERFTPGQQVIGNPPGQTPRRTTTVSRTLNPRP